MMQLDTLARHFRQIRLSPYDWPVHCVASIAETEALAEWPGFPQAATLAHDRLGHGAGEDLTTARTRATGELVEIASCCETCSIGGSGGLRFPHPEAISKAAIINAEDTCFT